MRVLFDYGTPRSLARFLAGHDVTEARASGWGELTNGDLLNAAEEAGHEVLVTTDKNIQYQQDLNRRKISLVVLGRGRRSLIEARLTEVIAAVDAAKPGSYVLVEIKDASR